MKRILIVEDFPILRQALKAFFELEGYWCAEAANGVEALGFFDAGQTVDLIISDNQMPVMGGIEFYSR